MDSSIKDFCWVLNTNLKLSEGISITHCGGTLVLPVKEPDALMNWAIDLEARNDLQIWLLVLVN